MTTNTITAYLGLGSNLDEPLQRVQAARRSIAQHEQIEELAFSSLYQSLPVGPQDQPDYINAVMAINTRLEPLDLLIAMQAIENAQGRVRNRHWGERTLDIDILLYGEQLIELPQLIVPHRELARRAFVLYPLYQIAPHLQLPKYGSLRDLLEHCPAIGLTRLS